MIHCPVIAVVSVVSLVSSDGCWSFLRETVHYAAVVADGLKRCGVEEKERAR